MVSSLDTSSLVHLLEAGELSPHLSPLHLDALDFSFEVLELSARIVVLISLLNGILSEAASLEVFLVQEALGAGELVIQVEVLLGPKR